MEAGHLSWRGLARRSRVRPQTVRNIMRGQTRPRADILGKLARGLGVSVAAFYHDGSKPDAPKAQATP